MASLNLSNPTISNSNNQSCFKPHHQINGGNTNINLTLNNLTNIYTGDIMINNNEITTKNPEVSNKAKKKFAVKNHSNNNKIEGNEIKKVRSIKNNKIVFVNIKKSKIPSNKIEENQGDTTEKHEKDDCKKDIKEEIDINVQSGSFIKPTIETIENNDSEEHLDSNIRYNH